MSFDALASNLPPLSADELTHQARILAALRTRMDAAGGVLSFADFMAFALYAPGLGYYSAGARKFGPDGDFVTAPELSPLFGRCLARQCREVIAASGGVVLEIGGGTGALAETLLVALAAMASLPERYLILEVSADLRERQQARLSALDPTLARRVEWLDRPPETPIRGILLANEVLDALPFERFVIAGGVPRRLGVSMTSSGECLEVMMDSSADFLAAAATALGGLAAPLPDGYRGEVRPALLPWIATLARSLERGALFLVDYGLPRAALYHVDRSDGTLLCHSRHRAHSDPFMRVGLQDLTAWVDFTMVAEAGVEAGLAVAGFATQAAFLLALGIEAEVAQESTGALQMQRASEARQLLLPGEMGEIFKVIALTRDLDVSLTGFALQDLRRQL